MVSANREFYGAGSLSAFVLALRLGLLFFDSGLGGSVLR